MTKPLKRFLLILSVLISGHVIAQTTPPVQPINPIIIVIPYTKEGQDIRTILESDDNMAIVINKIKEGFNNRNFNTVDFVAKLKQAEDQKVLRGQNLSDIKSQLIAYSGADIYVEVQLIKYSENGLNQGTVLLQAYDVASGRSMASLTCESNKNVSNNWGALFGGAISKQQSESQIPNREVFLNTLQASIDSMVKDGRPVTLQIGFSQDSKYDADAKVNGKSLSNIVDKWLNQNSKSLSQPSKTTTIINYNEIRIPYRDDATGRVTRLSSFIDDFTDYLGTFGLNATSSNKGSIIYITIN